MRIEQLGKAWQERLSQVPIDSVPAFRAAGLVLGAGTVLARANRQPALRSIRLPDDKRLLTLLSAAYGRLIGTNVLGHIRRGAMQWELGEDALAAMHLALTGLGRLGEPREGARRLFLADLLLEAGATPETILRALEPADWKQARDFDPNQPRVPKGNGRPSGQWTAGLSNAIQTALRQTGSWALRMLSTETAAALGRLAARFPAPAVFLGVLFIPTPQASNEWRDVPGRPGLRYRALKYQPGWEIAYRDTGGHEQTEVLQESGGVLRGKNGEVVGRVLPGGALAADLSIAAPSLLRPDEPRACRAPTKDKYGQGPDSVGRAYEIQVKQFVNPDRPTPAELGVALINPMTGRPVVFDDCQHSTGNMIEAKGPTFTTILMKSLKDPKNKPYWGVVNGLLDQSERQVLAAGSREVVWYFADRVAAHAVRSIFAEEDKGRENIEIRVLPYREAK